MLPPEKPGELESRGNVSLARWKKFLTCGGLYVCDIKRRSVGTMGKGLEPAAVQLWNEGIVGIFLRVGC